MSDLYLFELVDNVWDGIGACDDNIVPRTVDGFGAHLKFQGASCKKPRHEVIEVTWSAEDMTKYSILGEKEKGLRTLEKNRILEKGLWSHLPDGMFPTSGDNESLKDMTSLASDDARMSCHGIKIGNVDSVSSEFCAGNSILVDECATKDNNIYRFSLNHLSETDGDGDLSFLNKNHEDKENCDLLYYGWGDIGNFEDVDRMFRSCDSTFGLGNLSNEDDLCWFSSSVATEDSRDALKADAKLNGVPEHYASSRPDNAVSSTIDSSKKTVCLSDKISSLNTKGDNAGVAHMSYLNVFGEELLPEQISPPKKQLEQLSTSGERKDQHLENGGSFHQYGNVKQSVDVKHAFPDSSCQFFSPIGLQRHKHDIGPDPANYVQTNVPYMHLNYNSPLDQLLGSPTLSCTKSVNNGNTSSTNESSYASDQVQTIENSSGPSFGDPSILVNENWRKIQYKQDTQASLKRNAKHAKVGSKKAFYDPVTVQRQVHQSEQDEGHSEVVGVSLGKPTELDSSNDQLSSCTSSVLDEVSLEESSFWHLQQVKEKLDIRTKLCIRDSLYRLAMSAERRHNCTNTKGGIRDGKNAAGSFVAKETNGCTGLMDLETGTNPIDRSIAHLLFHRPSGKSLMLFTSDAPFKPHSIIHGNIT